MVNTGFRILLPNVEEGRGYRDISKEDFCFISWMGMAVCLKNIFLWQIFYNKFKVKN